MARLARRMAQMTEPYFDDPERPTRDEVEAEEKAESYRARARVLLSAGPDRRDFVQVLDGLRRELEDREEYGAAEAAADLASVIELI